MHAIFVVQVSNTTPIVSNGKKSVTLGTLGPAWLCRSTKGSLGTIGSRSSAASKRIPKRGFWRFRNGCSIQPFARACGDWRRYPQLAVKPLLDLKSLLHCAPVPNIGVVLQAQHRSLLSPGGADAEVAEPQDHSIHTVSTTTEKSSLQELPREIRLNVVGLLARTARALWKAPRLRHEKGGGRALRWDQVDLENGMEVKLQRKRHPSRCG
jgi:hypothetical protein